MAPIQPSRPDKEKRIPAILAFAAELEAQLTSAINSRTSSALLDTIQQRISSFPHKALISAQPRCEELDARGTSLWNLCTRLKRGLESEGDAREGKDVTAKETLMLAARVFSFYLLDCAWTNGQNAAGNLTRLWRCGAKAAKGCLERKETELAIKVLERASIYEELLTKNSHQIGADDKEACWPLCAEYYVLRTALAWHAGQQSLADHMYNKATTIRQPVDPDIAESLADVLYEMGKDLLQKYDYKLALKWLNRAHDVLVSQEADRLSMDAAELRISIIQTQVKVLIAHKEPETIEKARNLIELLENEVGGKLVVLLLRLEMLSLSKDEAFDSAAYGEVLHRMTRILHLSDDNFKLMLFHIRELNKKNSHLASIVLDDLLSTRILVDGKHEQIEKMLITRLYLLDQQADNNDLIPKLERFIRLIAGNLRSPISSECCLAAQTLLWMRIESSYNKNNFEVAEKWSRLAIDNIFQNAGEINMARISRKLLLCALGRQDISSAREIYTAMPASAKNEPTTRFLMYKIAIRCEELDLAAECLQIISSSTSDDPSMLYACCLDAQQVGSKPQTVEALLLVVEKYGNGEAKSVHLPSLLRTTIGLIVDSLAIYEKRVEIGKEQEALIEKLIVLFERAVKSINKPQTSGKESAQLWTVLELDWFSKNSYNLVAKNMALWSPRHSLRMLICCVAFIDHYPSDIGSDVYCDLCLRKLFCEFCSATALIALARGEDNIELQLQDYLKLRKHVDSFDKLLQERHDKMEEVVSGNLYQKLSVLLAFDFEAACRLKDWDGLGECILKSAVCKSMRAYQVMADCLLCSKAPTEVLINTMKRLINQAWEIEELDLPRLAKYMRCLFQVALAENSEIAESLLDQVNDHAEQAFETETPYPYEELEWISTTAFNYAVDLYCIGDRDEDSRSWAQRAINLAHWCGDRGVLERLLQERFVRLEFDSNR